MNSIPLIKGNTPQEINTSIIALKKALSELEAQDRLLQGTDKDVQDKIKQINELIEGINTHLGTVDTHLTTIDGQITALQPVDTVTSGNMHSVTSNAVAGMFKLLWSNSSPSSDFSAQSISIPTMNDYSMLLVILNWASYSQMAINQVLIMKGQSTSQFNVMTYDIDGSTIYSVARNVTISNNQINITDGTLFSGVNKVGTRNDICIPVKIYGIK